MAEQVFDLDIKIDDKFWSNFSSHPSRSSSLFTEASTSTNIVEKEIKEEKPAAPKKTAEEIIQSSQPLDDKMTALFQGDFKIDKQTKPSYHLLMDFEDKEGVPLILAKPSFTQQDVEKYFQNLEKPKVAPVPVPVIPVQPIIIQVVPQIDTSLQTQEIPQPIQETPVTQEERREYIEERPEEPKVNQIQQQENLREGGIVNTRVVENIPDNELEARSLHVSRPYEGEPIIPTQKQETLQPIIDEVPSFPVHEKRIEEEIVTAKTEESVPVVRKKVRFDGQILGSTLLRKISFDSFHYVKIQPWRHEQSFLFDRFIKRTKFSKYISETNSKFGPNHLIKSYFNEGILKTPYLIERYFRNPFIYSK